MNNRRGTLFVLVLGIALATALWAIVRLASFQQQRQETIVYTDAPGLKINPPALSCNQSHDLELDIRDYSYNVVKEPTVSQVYRYKTNLDAKPPVDVHILSIRGGSGRVVISQSKKPVWLVLLSPQSAIWHIERAPGAIIERIVASQSISELHFSDRLVARSDSVFDMLIGSAPDAIPLPDIDVIPQVNCMAFLQRFQKYDDRKKFAPTLRGIRRWLGHPEMSFQSSAHPSYFELPFRVPFPEPEVSVERLAAVAKLMELPPAAANDLVPRGGSPAESRFERYANMPRRADVRAVTFDDPREFIAVLESYRTKGLIPSSMPASGRGGQGLDVVEWYSLSEYQNAYTRKVLSGTTEDACNGGRDHEFLIIEGTDDRNFVKCAWGKQMYFMRGGDDRIDDSWEDDIIYAGPGDDIIEAGWGNDLIFFNFGWGQDAVDKTCHRAPYRPQDSAGSKKVNWSTDWPYKNFIVFGKDITEADIVRVNNKLVHKQTGDSITIKGDCFNTVFWR